MIKPKRCPVSGYEEMNPLDEHGCASYEICPCCGCQAGYEYDTNTNETRILELRKKWREEKNGAWWDSKDKPPIGWNPDEQMKKAGIKI